MIKKFSEFINESFKIKEGDINEMDLNDFYNYLNKQYYANIRKYDSDNVIAVYSRSLSFDLVYEINEKIILFKENIDRDEDVQKFIDLLKLQDLTFKVEYVMVDDSGKIISTGLDDSNFVKITPVSDGKECDTNNFVFKIILDTLCAGSSTGIKQNYFDIEEYSEDELSSLDINEMFPDQLCNYIMYNYEFLGDNEVMCSRLGDNSSYKFNIVEPEGFYDGDISLKENDHEIVHINLCIDPYSNLYHKLENDNDIDIFYNGGGDVIGPCWVSNSRANVYYHKISNDFILRLIDKIIEYADKPVIQKK